MGSKEKRIGLRCFAYQGTNNGRNGYYAICIDLTLVTWRPTYKAAKASLNQAIVGYLEAKVLSLSPKSSKEFARQIRRLAPFWPYRARYYFGGIFELFGKKEETGKFRSPIPESIFTSA